MILKIVIGIILLLEGIIGIRFLLNLFGLLGTQIYSKLITATIATSFLSIAISGLYFLLIKPNIKWALWIGLGPWGLIIIFSIIALYFGKYQ